MAELLSPAHGMRRRVAEWLQMQNYLVATVVYFFVTYGFDAYAFNGKYYAAMLAVISRIYQHVR